MKWFGRQLIGFSIGWLLVTALAVNPNIRVVTVGALIGLIGVWIYGLDDKL